MSIFLFHLHAKAQSTQLVEQDIKRLWNAGSRHRVTLNNRLISFGTTIYVVTLMVSIS